VRWRAAGALAVVLLAALAISRSVEAPSDAAPTGAGRPRSHDGPFPRLPLFAPTPLPPLESADSISVLLEARLREIETRSVETGRLYAAFARECWDAPFPSPQWQRNVKALPERPGAAWSPPAADPRTIPDCDAAYHEIRDRADAIEDRLEEAGGAARLSGMTVETLRELIERRGLTAWQSS
jgi:hypothetical protein